MPDCSQPDSQSGLPCCQARLGGPRAAVSTFVLQAIPKYYCGRTVTLAMAPRTPPSSLGGGCQVGSARSHTFVWTALFHPRRGPAFLITGNPLRPIQPGALATHPLAQPTRSYLYETLLWEPPLYSIQYLRPHYHTCDRHFPAGYDVPGVVMPQQSLPLHSTPH